MKQSIIIFAIFLMTFATTAYAQNNSFSIKASTLGVGLELERTFSDSIGSRVGGIILLTVTAERKVISSMILILI